jgi:DNA sulfur modification protein DndC
MSCIFGSASHFATIRYIAPDWFWRLVAYERRFGCTIRRSIGLEALADRGTVYQTVRERPDLVRAALHDEYDQLIHSERWEMPAGAFGDASGPS